MRCPGQERAIPGVGGGARAAIGVKRAAREAPRAVRDADGPRRGGAGYPWTPGRPPTPATRRPRAPACARCMAHGCGRGVRANKGGAAGQLAIELPGIENGQK